MEQRNRCGLIYEILGDGKRYYGVIVCPYQFSVSAGKAYELSPTATMDKTLYMLKYRCDKNPVGMNEVLKRMLEASDYKVNVLEQYYCDDVVELKRQMMERVDEYKKENVCVNRKMMMTEERRKEMGRKYAKASYERKRDSIKEKMKSYYWNNRERILAEAKQRRDIWNKIKAGEPVEV